jgi:hypothetical protein
LNKWKLWTPSDAAILVVWLKNALRVDPYRFLLGNRMTALHHGLCPAELRNENTRKNLYTIGGYSASQLI